MVPKLLGAPGAVFGDIDEVHNVITVGFSSEQARAAAERILPALGVPSSAVLFEVRAGKSQTEATLSDYTRPALGALRIDGWEGCTLGFNVAHYTIDQNYNSTRDAEECFVSDSHCTTQWGGASGDIMYQGGSSIGIEAVDPLYLPAPYVSACPPGMYCRTSDVALFRYSNAADANHGYVAWTGSGSATITGSKPVTGEGDPSPGTRVEKIGFASGHTSGTVTRTCVTYQESEGPNAKWLTCVAEANYPSTPGDSGAPVMFDAGGYVTAMGMHIGEFGGYRYFSMTNEWQAEINSSMGGAVCTTTNC